MTIDELAVKITGDSSSLQDALKGAGDKLGGFGINVGDMGKLLGGAGLAGAMALAAKAVMDAGKEFDGANENIAKSTGATGQALSALNTSFKNVVAGGVEQSIDDVSKAFGMLSQKLDITGAPLEALTANFANFADVNNTSVAEAVATTTDVMRKWQISVNDAPMLLDQITKASQETGISQGELSGLLKGSGAQLQTLGMSLTDSIALFGAFAKDGVNSSSVMTGLNFAIIEATKSGKDASDILGEAFSRIKEAKDPTEAAAIAMEYFGKKAGPEMAGAIRNGTTSIADLTEKLKGAKGTVGDTANASDTLADKWATISNQFKVILEPIGTLLFDVAKSILDVFIPAVQVIFELVSPALNMIKDIFVSTFSDVSGVLKTFVQIVKDIFSGNWKNVWIDVQIIALEALGMLTTGISNAVNVVVKQVNGLLAGVNTILKAVGIPAIKEMQEVSLSAMLGIDEKVKALKASLVATAEVHTDLGNAAKVAAEKAVKATSDVIEMTKEEAKALAKAQEEYRTGMLGIETRAKAGIITEQDAADAKYAANKKLIDDLIALGYTGDAASKSIGDKTLAEAVARNAALLADTTAVKDAILAGNYEIYLQQKDVAAWEKKYLEDKKKTTVDQVLYLVEFERVEREQALLEYQAYLDEMINRAKLQAEKERIENEQKLIEYQAYLDTMTEKATYQATLEQIVWDQKTIDYEQHLTDMQAAADYAAELERVDNEQKLIEYQAYLDDMTTASTYQAEVEKIAYEQRSVEYQSYLDEMTDKAKLAAETERIEQEQRLIEYQAYLDDMEVKAKLADEKERIEQEQKLVEYQGYLDEMADKAELADEKERIENEQKLVEYQAYLDERTDQAKIEEEKARIDSEQKLVEYQAYLDTMADDDKYQTEKAKIEYDQRTIEYAQYLSDMSDKATYQVEIEKVASEQRSIEIAASYEEYLADMTNKATKADIAAAEYARAVEDADVESKKSSLQRKIEAIQAQLDKELLLVGDNENAKKILIDTADKAISDATEADAKKNSRALQGAYNKTFNIIAEGISSISSLISEQTDAAVEAVEDRLAELEDSYGSTASELQTMYDALEEMGATDAAATVKAQLEKESAIEDYTSLSQEQLATLYASAIEMNNAETAAEIAAAQARVKAEDDAAAEIKAIRAEAALAEWQMKRWSLLASTAQAAMDAYKFLTPLVGPIFALAGPAAALAVGGIQLAAIDEAKPKLDTGGVVRAREGTSVTVGAGTGEVMFGTSSLGDPLMKGFMDGVASRVMEKLNIPINIPLTLNGKIVAEEVMYRVDNGLVRRTGASRR